MGRTLLFAAAAKEGQCAQALVFYSSSVRVRFVGFISTSVSPHRFSKQGRLCRRHCGLAAGLARGIVTYIG